MRSSLFLSLCLGTVACAPSGEDVVAERLGERADTIVNGQVTTGEPATVYLEVGCSGTLISPRVVLTACHCQPYAGSWVFFGSDSDGQGDWIQSVDALINPNTSCQGDGDIAVMTLSEPGPTTPIPIYQQDIAEHAGEEVRIVGFGQTSENGGGSGTKRVGYTVLDSVDSGIMWSNPQNGSGTCYGDSGGPNFMTVNGVEYVAGVTSFGTTACGSPWDGAAQVDPYSSWIQAYIDENDPADCGADGACAAFCDAPDPDCPCADDGHCTSACSELGSDPDCEGCGDDGACRVDCPALDHDCCGADGECFAGCSTLDPDCGDDPVDPGVDDDGGPSFDPGGDDEDEDEEPADPGGLEGKVSCAVAVPGDSGSSVWWLAALVAVFSRRRR